MLANKITFDHAYTADPNHKFLKSLERMGFAIRPGLVEHPGGSICRFIGFRPSPDSAWQYLEFIDRRGTKGQYRRPGLSLTAGGNLRQLFKKFNAQGALSTCWEHRNYNWKTDPKSNLPGWNFITFKKLGFSTFYPWFTEYDRRPGQKKISKIRHPNGITKIRGFELFLNKSGKKVMSVMLQRDLLQKQNLSNEICLWVEDSASNRLSTIVLEAKSLVKCKKFLKSAKETVWKGQRALKLENPSGNNLMWDIVVVPSEKAHIAMSEHTALAISKIRALVNTANYSRAESLVKSELRKHPKDIYLLYHKAVMAGDNSESRNSHEIESRRKDAVKQFKKLVPKIDFYNKDYKSRVLNEYYWFSKQYKNQYNLGLKEIRTGYMAGYYSMGVGACWYAKSLIEIGQYKRAMKWAEKSKEAWENYFKYQPRWYNSWLFYGVALDILGLSTRSAKAYLTASKISGKALAHYENLEMQSIGKKLREQINTPCPR